MNKPKVSIILPIYNAGDRIFQCMNTLVNQTLKDIEIICILDCPSDGTDRIVEDYASKDARITVIHNPRNLGVSESRNAGLTLAKGEYIGFSDHDDYRDLRMYEVLYHTAIRESAEIVLSDVLVIHESREKEIVSFHDPSRDGLIRSLVLPINSVENQNRMCCSCWHSIYKSQVVKSVRFHERSEVFEEDRVFNLEALLNVTKIAYVRQCLYVWDKHFLSESNRALSHEEAALRTFNQILFIDNYLINNELINHFSSSFCVLIYDYIWRYYIQYRNIQYFGKF